MEKLKIGDRVRQKFTRADRRGTIIGIWEHDYQILDDKNQLVTFAIQGEFKVKLDNNSENSYITFSNEEITKINE